MIRQSYEMGCAWKHGFLKSSHIYYTEIPQEVTNENATTLVYQQLL